MRTISYKCDRCGKPMTGRSAVKLSVTLQRGADAAEKSTLDFCQKCFLKVKNAYVRSLSDVEEPVTKEPVAKEPAVKELVAKEPVKESIVKPAIPVGPVTKDGSSYRFTVETPEKKTAEEPSYKPVDMPVQETVPEDTLKDNGDGIITGPLTKEEHALILKLHVEEGLSAEEIAVRMKRLTRGVKRCINSAAKSGQLDRMKAEYEAGQEKEAEEETSESNAGSGASNAGILKDGYTAPPQTEVIEGKRYDVGGILALAKAGWKPRTIADERHYDEDAVRLVLEKYMR